MSAQGRNVLLLVLILLSGGTLTLQLLDDDGDGRPDRVVVTTQPAPQVPTAVKVDGPDADGKLDDRLTVSPQAAERLEDQLEASQAELKEPLREQADAPATTTVPGPLAADEIEGCRTRFVGNSSSRGSARPQAIFLHQTVSRENGWSSQNALTAMAGRRSSGVSWHFLVGRAGGRCTYTVPLALKAWTQANANPYAVGIEVEAYGNEGAYVVGAGKAKLVSVVRQVARRYGIPLRRGKVNTLTCTITIPGIVEHSDAGVCGGGHVDVTLAPSNAASAIAAAARAGGQPVVLSRNDPRRYRLGVLTAGERRQATCLLYERRVAAKHGGWAKVDGSHRRRAVACKGALARRNLQLHVLGLSRTAARAQRHRVIHEVV